MFSSRRLAKRSIIGTRVCCQRQDGRYHPGQIQSTEAGFVGNDRYTIMFDDRTSVTVFDRDIVGPGFRSVSTVKFIPGQKVFITHNGREVIGVVDDHDQMSEEVCIVATSPNGEELEVVRRVDEVRLLESRKSARLQDQDTDYSRLADVHSEPKKRAVSHVIDVPLPAAKQSRRRKSSLDTEEQMVIEDEMDEHMAAMVLTSLSCSPTSPSFPAGFTEKGSVSPNVASSFGSSGVGIDKSDSGTPSPPQIMSVNAPPAQVFGTPPIDEGIELDDTHAYFMDDDVSSAKRRKSATRTVFKCTWPGCNKIHNSNSGIEQHVRHAHLGPRDEDDDSDLSDHEEEFYYTEIEVSVDTVTETFADMYTSSPPPITFDMQTAIPDHDYQKKMPEPRSLPQNIPGRHSFDLGGPQGSSYPFTGAANQHPGFSSSWDMPSTSVSPPFRMNKGSAPSRSIMASSPMHKKSRSDIKKCRKVYGMENRDLWCTQCKWKKACSRFSE